MRCFVCVGGWEPPLDALSRSLELKPAEEAGGGFGAEGCEDIGCTEDANAEGVEGCGAKGEVPGPVAGDTVKRGAPGEGEGSWRQDDHWDV